MSYDPAKELVELKDKAATLEDALQVAIAAGNTKLQGHYYRAIADNQNAQAVVLQELAVAQRPGENVDDDFRQDIELTVNVHSFDDGAAPCRATVKFDARCGVAILLCEKDFDSIAATAKLPVRSCDKLVGGFKVTQRAFAYVALPDIGASADCAIYRGGPGGVSVFGRPLMELMHIRCNPDKSVSKCTQQVMGYRGSKEFAYQV